MITGKNEEIRLKKFKISYQIYNKLKLIGEKPCKTGIIHTIFSPFIKFSKK